MSRRGIMLAYPLEEKRLLKWQPPYICQPKLDGIRCRAVNINGAYILLSSEENILYLPHITEALNRTGLDLELDGEIYRHGWPLEQINGIASRTVNPHPDADLLQFYIFDLINDIDIQATRITTLKRLIVQLPLVTVPFAIAINFEEVMEQYSRYIDLGYEGIIVRHHLAPYIRRRSTYILKFKPKKFDIYLITGWKEEVSKDGILKGSLGALEVWDGSNHFSVGSGLTAENRRYLWEVRDSLIGKYAKIGYQQITNTNKVPRHTVFIGIVEKNDE